LQFPNRFSTPKALRQKTGNNKIIMLKETIVRNIGSTLSLLTELVLSLHAEIPVSVLTLDGH